MVQIHSKMVDDVKPAVGPRVLYIGHHADEVCDLVSPHIGMLSIFYTREVNDALAKARAQQFDIIIVDQRDERLASKLIVPLLASLGYPVKLVVVSALKRISEYLQVPGVARVLTAPIRVRQLTKVLGLDPSKLRHDRIKLAAEAKDDPPPKRMNPLLYVSNMGMAFMSTAYKRMAFVLLGILFVSFTFYGFMIGFFLISSGWAAPETLNRGHAAVAKIEKDLGDLRLSLNMNDQRFSEITQVQENAVRTEAEAAILVNFASDTVDKEIKSRMRQLAVLERNIARTQKTHRAFVAQLSKGRLGNDLANLFDKHLIDRKTYSSNIMGLLESGQRMSGLEGQVDLSISDKEQFLTQIAMLKSLRSQLHRDGPLANITAASSDLLLLTKQALDARAALQTAKSQIALADTTKKTLLDSNSVLKQQIVNYEQSTFGRAITQRVDVLFVPYGNASQFKPGAALYTCKFTMIFCWKAGTIRQILPGEINSVHPFFGKPIRGFYVEADLTDSQAATREIVHAGRPPFFL